MSSLVPSQQRNQMSSVIRRQVNSLSVGLVLRSMRWFARVLDEDNAFFPVTVIEVFYALSRFSAPLFIAQWEGTHVCIDYKYQRIIPVWSSQHRLLNSCEQDINLVQGDIMVQIEDVLSNQAGDEQHNADQSGDLIEPIGRDITMNCLLRISRARYGFIASLNRNFRSLMRSGEMYKLRRVNGIAEHWLYYSCQLPDWEALDLYHNRWMRVPRMDCSEDFKHSDKDAFGVGTQLLVFGNDTLSYVVFKYSLLTHSWSLGRVMNSPRFKFGAASLGHIAIVAGGCDSQGHILNSAELYNSETESWEILPPMNKPRKLCTGVYMDGKFLMIGGISTIGSEFLTCGEEFDFETRTWKVIPNLSGYGRFGPDENQMPASAVVAPLVAVVNNQLYAADHYFMALRKYDKVKKTWSTIGELPEHASSATGLGLAVIGCGPRLIVAGGPRNNPIRIVEVSFWVPCDRPIFWSSFAKSPRNSYIHNCAVMGC